MASFKVIIKADKCKGCGLCVSVCPKKVLALTGAINNKGYRPAAAERIQDCVGCSSCALMCPDCCIEIYGEDE